MGSEAARAIDAEIEKTEKGLKETQTRLREIRFALALRVDPEFTTMMDIVEKDPEAGVSADELLKKLPDLG